MKRFLLSLSIFLVIAVAATRVLRDAGFINLPPNVAPVAALALFSGVYLPRQFALVLPLAAMAASDAVIGFYHPGIMASVYVSFVLTGFLGWWLRSRKTVLHTISVTLTGSTLFFLATNAAVWAFGNLYPHDSGGLVSAYVAGLPFFRNTLLGDLGFVGLLFGAYELAALMVRRREAAREVT